MSLKTFDPAILVVGTALAIAAGLAVADESTRTTVVQPTANGDVIVRTSMPEPKPAGPPPAFALLDQRQRGYLDEEDARGYPPLGTDFIHADADRDSRISKAEYERWVNRP